MSAGLDDLLAQVGTHYAGRPEVLDRIARIQDRADGPVRIALAGMVESGKSTLLDAILGEDLAATVGGDTARIVTWYRYRRTPRVTLQLSGGMRLIRPFTREGGRLRFDLGGNAPGEILRLEIDWPAEVLKRVTIIDTPGIGSASKEVSAQTETALMPETGALEADAVIYLMRHLHEEDVRFLETLRRAAGGASGGELGAPGVLAVLSRADEVGGGRIDSLLSARAIADRYRGEIRVSRLVDSVLPLAGLLARTARTLRDDEFDQLTRIARLDRPERSALLFSVGRFLGHRGDAVLDIGIRRDLLDRFGLYGIRIAAVLIDGGIEHTAELADELARGSGFERILAFVDEQYLVRAEQLKTASALGAVEAVLREHPIAAAAAPAAAVPDDGTAPLSMAIERLRADEAHSWAESRLLLELRTGRYRVDPELLADARRILGGDGVESRQRLGLDPDADDTSVARSVSEALTRWRDRTRDLEGADDELSVRLRAAAVQSAERLLHDEVGAGEDWSGRRLSLLAPEPRPRSGKQPDDERHAG